MYEVLTRTNNKTSNCGYCGESVGKTFRRYKIPNGTTNIIYCDSAECYSNYPSRPYMQYRSTLSRHKSKEMSGEPLTFEEYKIIRSDTCIYCGDPSTGLDRIDSSIGYTINNVAPACERCNVMKMSRSQEEFITHIRKIQNYTKSWYNEGQITTIDPNS